MYVNVLYGCLFQGESPLAPFTLGAKIKVKVIGFREFKKDKPG